MIIHDVIMHDVIMHDGFSIDITQRIQSKMETCPVICHEIIAEDTDGQEALFFFARVLAKSGYTVCVPVSTRTVMQSEPHLVAHLMVA